MVTITINIKNGNEASEACREVARMIDNGYTNGMIGCSGDTFEIEGDIFSDEEGDDEFEPTESGKAEVRITAVENHHNSFSFYGDAVNTSHFRLTELFGEDNGDSDESNYVWTLLFDVKYKNGVSEQFVIYLYDINYGVISEDTIIDWNIGCCSNVSFNAYTAYEVIDMLIGGRMENDEYKILEVKKKTF